MSEYKRDNTRPRKQVSSIFKGIQIPQANEARRPSVTPATGRVVYTESKSTAPKQQKSGTPKLEKSSQVLPKTDSAAQPKAHSVTSPKVAPDKKSKDSSLKQPETTPVTQHKTASVMHPKVAPDTKSEDSSPKLPETDPVTQHKTASVMHTKAAAETKFEDSSPKLPETAPVTQSEAVPAERQKIIPVKRHKALPTKKQIAVKIQYLKTAGVIWAACFVVFLLAYILILGPLNKHRKSIEKELTEKKQIYESAIIAAKKETKDRLNEQILDLQNRMKNFIIDFEDSANLTFEISQIANEKNVASFSIKGKENTVQPGKTDSKYLSENQIVISFIGEFSQFATFLNALERHRPVLLVDKFTISQSGQDDSVFRVSLNVSAFVRKQQSEKLISQENKITDKRLDKVDGMKI